MLLKALWISFGNKHKRESNEHFSYMGLYLIGWIKSKTQGCFWKDMNVLGKTICSRRLSYSPRVLLKNKYNQQRMKNQKKGKRKKREWKKEGKEMAAAAQYICIVKCSKLSPWRYHVHLTHSHTLVHIVQLPISASMDKHEPITSHGSPHTVIYPGKGKVGLHTRLVQVVPHRRTSQRVL